MSSDFAEGLNARRDAYVQSIRALCEEVTRRLDGDLKGILGRAGTLLGAQEDNLRRLQEADLDRGGEGPVRALMGAQHLPRMILALGEVFAQQEKEEDLRPLQRRALELGQDLAILTQDWVLAHQDDLDLLGELEL